MAQNKRFSQITAVMWMDQNPVHILSSGGNREIGTVARRVDGEIRQVPAPDLVRDYHCWMGSVDVHDQLWMQRYSVQLGYKSRKYYRALFLGPLVLVLVNAFIVHRYHRKVNNKRPPKHFAFFEELMKQLLVVDTVEAFNDIAEATSMKERTAPSPARSVPTQEQQPVPMGHHLEKIPDTVDCDHGVKRRHWSCKVCAIYPVKPRKFTKYFSPG
ncbi:hypothetical protein PC121_g20815 [Phytophthora cactorum]|nr:hypothetical protein PC120_g23146 [Phytophthora cactorum]KAG3046226.1 hypothetical protein PC121_g20815 [Phytophthora cactorum]